MKKKFALLLPIALLGLCGGIITPLAMEIKASQAKLIYQYRISFETNGGKALSSIRYATGDRLKLPTPQKDGFEFGGWFFDNETFNKPCISGDQITSNVVLYAKWNKKSVPIYFETFYQGEFETIYKEVGETLSFSDFPINPQTKKEEGVEYPFVSWKDGGEYSIGDDYQLTVKDRYYSFHASYGSPKMDDKYVVYSNTFDEDYGYIDPSASWSRTLDWPIKNPTATTYRNPEITADRDVVVEGGLLKISQLNTPLRYIENGVYLPSVAYPGSEYSITVRAKIDEYLSTGDAKGGIFDTGFGVAVRVNDETKAYVANMVDGYSKCVRVAARNGQVAGSGAGVNTNFKKAVENVDQFHTYKIDVSGSGKDSQMAVYVDGTLAYTYSDTSASKTWFEKEAIGKKIVLFANACSVSIDSIKVEKIDGSSTYYQQNFDNLSSYNFMDGWTIAKGAIGSNHGESYIQDGRLHINDGYSFTHYHHHMIQTPVKNFSKGVISFDLKIEKLAGSIYNDATNSNSTKYLSLCLRSGESDPYNYGAITFRQSGTIQLYKHAGEKFGAWGSAVKGVRGASKANQLAVGTSYEITVVLLQDKLSIFVDGTKVGDYTQDNHSLFQYDSGGISLLASSIDVSIDNFRVATLAE